METIKNEITAILTIWQRNHLKKQLECIINQTKRPYQIWIYQNESHLNVQLSEEIKKEYNISIIHSKDINFKFHARFALPLLCNTEYVAIFDDDTMPGSRWFENCLYTSKRKNSIVGANGRTLKKGFEEQEGQHMTSIGGGAPVQQETEVDFVGHCWFFKTEWAKNLWMDRPYSWDNGEDIHFSAACKIHQGIRSFVPELPADDKSLWGDTQPFLGDDEHSTYKTSNHSRLRAEVSKYWCKMGWEPLCLKD
jgi:hypothetical protein